MKRTLMLAGLVLLWPTPGYAYRTLADDPAFESDPPPRWADPHIEFELHVELGPPTPAAIEGALLAAAAEWQTPTCSSLRFHSSGPTSVGAAPGDGRNTLEVVVAGWDTSTAHGESGARTDVQVTRGPDGVWRIVEADVYLDWSRRWALGDASEGDSLRVALRHELGHALGLLHPCELDGSSGPVCDGSERESALYPLYAVAPSLAADDVAGLCALYPAQACADGCPAGTRCEDGACVGCFDCAPACDAGVCAELCAGDTDCGADERCAASGDRAGTCVARGAVGAGCDSADDCGSALCLAGAGPTPHCAAACGATSDCSDGEQCAIVESQSVCAPLAAGGCSVAHRGSPTWRHLLAALVACAIGRSSLRRRPRIS